MSAIIVLALLAWSTPIDLSVPGAQDVTPEVCRMQSDHTCLVFRSNVDGDWEIFSRFSGYGPYFSDTVRVTENHDWDFYPAVAYQPDSGRFWCVWTQVTIDTSHLQIAYGDHDNGWSAPITIPGTTSADQYPSIVVAYNTVWVAWQRQIGSTHDIYAIYFDGTTWSDFYKITDNVIYDDILPRLGVHHLHPIVTWQHEQDIYYSDCIGGAWQTPVAVTTDPGLDERPDFCEGAGWEWNDGGWIAWQSDRDGNYELYRTGFDTLDTEIRITNNPATDNWAAALDFYMFTARWDEPTVAFTTDRNGHQDIYAYSSFWGSPDTLAIESDPSSDMYPCMTGGDGRVWIIWQSDRDGDDDIYGSFMDIGSVAENAAGGLQQLTLTATPNPFAGSTRLTCPAAAHSGATIHDVSGRLIWRGRCDAHGAMVWNGRDDRGAPVPAGVYLYRVDGPAAATKVLIKTQ